MTNPVGHPTHYTPEICEKFIKYFRKGWSIEEICLELNVSVQTYYNWKAKYPEFFEAIKTGEFFSKGNWMKKGRKSLRDKDFSYTGWYMNMKNRFGWTDKQEVKTDIEISVPEEIQKARKEYIKEY